MRREFRKFDRVTIVSTVIFMVCLAVSSPTVDAQQRISVKPDLNSRQGIGKWDLDGSGVWEISNGKLVISKAGVPAGPIRRPAALAILKTISLRRATIEGEIHSTAPLDVVRRDLDVVVSYESPTRFYYIHLAGVTDSVHNGIFLVNHADRVRIDSGKGKPQLQDTLWHSVRVERDGLSGRISVFVDRSKAPVLEAVDTTICCGRVGFGSFDDTGEFRNIVVTGSGK
ncbi:MAG TPA: hypothetical protein VMH23_20120 [Bacteroidota bacterium]|nr:hypothetical protein [Bacteroidota bacterium]